MCHIIIYNDFHLIFSFEVIYVNLFEGSYKETNALLTSNRYNRAQSCG